MRRSVAIGLATILLFLTATLAGCLGPGQDDVRDIADDTLDLLARGEPLFWNPQDFPHPMFGWPTLTNPPSGDNVPAWWRPIAPAAFPATITGMEHVATTGTDVPGGRGSAFFGSLAVVPFSKTFLVDISDPATPVKVGEIDKSTRGAAIIAYPDNRLVTVLATASDILVWDITDPTEPKDLGGLSPPSSHKVGVVPGTPIVYNAPSNGGGSGTSYFPDQATGVTQIYDLSDPDDPVHVQDFPNGYGCHHIYFYNDPSRDLYRAYCAGIQMTQIWDTTDPRNPVVLTNIPVHHGNGMLPHNSVGSLAFSHFSIANQDATVLIVGDETGGGGLPGCDVYTDAAGQTVSGPIGNLWFYDISDESDPKLLSWMSPTAPALMNLLDGENESVNCTAHHGRLVPDPEGRDLLAMAFYSAGVVLVDFSDATNPVIVDQYRTGTNTWEVWHYNGYLFTGDMAKGMDVLRFT
jgi:hypothetical protein